MTEFSITPAGEDAALTVRVDIPAAWQTTSTADGPQFAIPGVEGRLITLTASYVRGSDAAARLDRAIGQQFSEPDTATRTALGDRAWVERAENAVVHGRMFVPYASGVVMGVAIVTAASAPHLAAIRQVFESIQVA